MTRCAMSLGNKACLIRRSLTSGEGGILSKDSPVNGTSAPVFQLMSDS
jgi:hypothetical protein